MRGPEGASVQQCTGATRRVTRPGSPEVPFAVDSRWSRHRGVGSHVRSRGIGPGTGRSLDDPRHAGHVSNAGNCARSEGKLAGAFAEIHEQVAGLLGGPRPGGVRGDAQDVHAPGLDLHHEEHVQAPEEHGVNMQEVARQDPGRLGGQELPPGR